jgi:hypothetical protein
MVFNLDQLGYQESVNGFTSGILTSQLVIPPTHSAYADPWIIGTDLSGEINLPSTTQVLDNGQIYVDFLYPFSGIISIVSFAEMNEGGALYESHTELSTELFPFTDIDFRGNKGIANPIHQTYPLPSNQDVAVSCECFDCLSGNTWLSGLTYKPNRVVYTTEDNMVVIPPSLSGHVVVHYEKKNIIDYKFREADLSPVSWMNTDRVLAIELEHLDPYELELIPDVQSIKIISGVTRTYTLPEDWMLLSEWPINGVSGEPTTNMNITINVLDEAAAACSGEMVTIRSDRPLYYTSSGTIVPASINIIDNTSGLLSLSSSMINSIPSQYVDGNSMFDEIVLEEVPTESIPIFDNNGFLFHTVSGMSTYRVPFIASLYDEVNDQMVHTLERESDKFGAVNVKIGFHNNDLFNKIRKVDVRAFITRLPEVSGETLITVIPTNVPNTFNYSDGYEAITNTISQQTTSEYLTVITETIMPVMPVFITSNENFNDHSGLINPESSLATDINDVYQIRDGYLIYHNYNLSGEIVFLNYGDNISLLDVGEVYGDN